MPELPEVETVRRGLEPVMAGALIERLELRRPDLRFPLPDALSERVSGRRILGLSRRAKYLLIDLDNGWTLLSHLGMSGSFRIEEGGQSEMPGEFHHARSKDEKHDHVVFHLVTGQGPVRVVYNDPRRFGFMDLFERREMESHPAFRDLGPEPLGNALQAGGLAARLAGKSQPLKGALLDQRLIAGLGNIYVCEALWRSHLSPLRKAGTLVRKSGRPAPQLETLVEAIRAVIAEAIEAGGSSLRDHIQTDGSLGYFQHSFAVYDQEGKPCRTEGCGGTVERIVQSGRSTFYCPSCQK
ncbi:bifunctional DNA-formamidopyrimidine glycosylase/DNA-(apurinic or apyrimidinic site) lyase [Gellertiella hungarica]|uniref:Formamidopyrimidine-DNA glycosylase n=1 Tax=Gellertiella hungarica TaxID=1572859 RepID=A0A7W6J2X3_9HYPH|nr:bifunctional DNA-formamidopyrimidine glycosylase/DNA-(apurinic or apyrimidinic site) lyase [Gellertiella hungarica]MBB4063769.1 formamidopyrimidine-DNA glycosylase [Gellertiella hungarica]